MNRIKTSIFNLIIKHLFKGFTQDDIIKYKEKENVFIFKGSIMSDNQVDNMMKTLSILKDNDGYQYLLSDVEYRSQEKLFISSSTIDDLMFSKSALYVIDILRQRRENLLKQYETWKSIKSHLQNTK